MSKRILIFVYMLMVIGGILLANAVFSYLTRPKKVTSIQLSTTFPIQIFSKIETEPMEIAPSIEIRSAEEELPKKIPVFSLQGILYSDTSAWAIINNRVLREKDTIEGGKVIKISSDSVELILEGEKISLKLK